jgi:ABC-2 type transport system permease protein
MAEARTAGAIYDLGYQRYTGARLGRAHAIRTLIAHSFRTAFGVGRGNRAKTLPGFVLAITLLPALIQVAIASAAGRGDMISYAGHLELTAGLLALFVAGQAPEVLVNDRQYGVMSLYLARPLTGLDYILAKYGAMVGAMLLMTLTPQLVLWGGRVFVDPAPWATFTIEYRKLLPIVGGCLLASCFYASIGLALSSFTNRRSQASAGIIALFLFLKVGAGLVRNFAEGDLRRFVLLADPFYLMSGYVNWLFDIEAKRRSVLGRADIPGPVYMWVLIGVTAAGFAILYSRYRKAEA